MTDTTRRDSGDERFIQTEIRRLPVKDPDPRFRSKLRQKFVNGPAQDGRGLLVPLGELHSRRFPQRRQWFTVIMAAATLAFVLTWLMQPQPDWRVTQAEVGGLLIVNQTEVLATGMIGKMLPADCYLSYTGPGPVRLDNENKMTWILEPGTQVRLKGHSILAGKKPLDVRILNGVAMASTGPGFPEAGLNFSTKDLSAHVSGTTFGVMAGPDSTCICVLEGRVIIDGFHEPVAPGTSSTVFSGRPPLTRPLREMERTGLVMTQKAARD